MNLFLRGGKLKKASDYYKTEWIKANKDLDETKQK